MVATPVQQIALVLKIVFGLTTSEISSLSFSNEVTVAQRLVRAQSRVRELPDFFHELNSNSLQSRRTTVCKILYLLFNEGYFSHSRENQLDTYVCQEALALIQELCSNPKIASPEALGPTKNQFGVGPVGQSLCWGFREHFPFGGYDFSRTLCFCLL